MKSDPAPLAWLPLLTVRALRLPGLERRGHGRAMLSAAPPAQSLLRFQIYQGSELLQRALGRSGQPGARSTEGSPPARCRAPPPPHKREWKSLLLQISPPERALPGSRFHSGPFRLSTGVEPLLRGCAKTTSNSARSGGGLV